MLLSKYTTHIALLLRRPRIRNFLWYTPDVLSTTTWNPQHNGPEVLSKTARNPQHSGPEVLSTMTRNPQYIGAEVLSTMAWSPQHKGPHTVNVTHRYIPAQFFSQHPQLAQTAELLFKKKKKKKKIPACL